MQNKNIIILATGGTIAGSGSVAQGAKYSPAQISINDIVEKIPGLGKLANVSAEQIFSIGSQNINDEHWLKLVGRVNELLQKQEIDGIVITHGTDSLEETAYFLSLTVKSSKPVVLVGSMRPGTALGADGSANLYNAVAVAANENAKGVLMAMAGKIFTARDVVKTHTSNIEAFSAPNSGPIGSVAYGKVQIHHQQLKTGNYFDVSQLSSLPKVDVVYMHVGFDAGVIDFLSGSSNKSRAIIIASFGNGNVSADILPSLISAAKNGVVIIKSSRVGAGFVEQDIEIEDAKYGFLTAGNLNPQKARVLAQLALTQTENLAKIQEIFFNY
ncbi:MAG: ansB [Rickettsiaceae bacterium]|jgi:L-asparaginase|nr:ansB [Rickettsiaceae bacterium]